MTWHDTNPTRKHELPPLSANGEDGDVEEGTGRPWEVVFLFLFLFLLHTVEVLL